MVLPNMTALMDPVIRPAYDDGQSVDSRETNKKYILLRDTVGKCKALHGSGSRSKLLAKRSEQKVLKGSLWQEIQNGNDQILSSSNKLHSLTYHRSSSTTSQSGAFKLFLESVEVEDLTLNCAAAFLAEVSDEISFLLLAIPTNEERLYFYSDQDRMYYAKLINVGSDVIVNKRNVPPCRATVRWKGRLAGKPGGWFGVEIMVWQKFHISCYSR